jgi:hypothetical protein
MTQKNVEIVIGRLATDEEFRRRFARDPSATLDGLLADGMNLNRVERRALAALHTRVLDELARTLSPQLQKADLRVLEEETPEEPGRTS